MPLICHPDTVSLANLFKEHGVVLVHACQLRDLESYLAVGGIPSRAHLESSGLFFTPFQTDDGDRVADVWDKVFFNLSDFGHWFAQGKGTLPNPYGPILLCLDPCALHTIANISLSLRSAGARGFNREAEGIALADVPRIFSNRDRPTRHIKFTKDLKVEFPEQAVSSPELNCEITSGFIPLSFVRHVIVDPYPELEPIVKALVQHHAHPFRFFPRLTTDSRKLTYHRLWDFLNSDGLDLVEFRRVRNLDLQTIQWISAVAAWDPNSFQFARYVSYIRVGTFEYVVRNRH